MNNHQGKLVSSSPLDFDATIHMLCESTVCMSEENGEKGGGVEENGFTWLDLDDSDSEDAVSQSSWRGRLIKPIQKIQEI